MAAKANSPRVYSESMLSWPFFLKKNGTRRKSPLRTIREFALDGGVLKSTSESWALLRLHGAAVALLPFRDSTRRPHRVPRRMERPLSLIYDRRCNSV